MTLPRLQPDAEPQTAPPGAVGLIGVVRSRLNGHGVGATLARGGMASLTVAGGSALLAFAAQAVMARLLGSQFGAYIYALTWVNLLSIVGIFGFDTGAVRFIGAYRGQMSWDRVRGFLRRSLQITIGASVVLGLAMAAWGLFRRGESDRALVPTLAAAGVLLPLLVTLRIIGAQLQAFHRAVFGRVLQDLVRPAGAVLVLAVAGWVAHQHITPPIAILTNAAIAAAVIVLGWRSLSSLFPTELREARGSYDTIAWVRGAVPLFLISVSQTLLNSTDTLMLGAAVGTGEAGRYAVASQVASMIAFAINSVNLILAPMIAELYAQRRRADLQRTLTLSARGVLAFGVVALFVLVVGGRYLLRIFGPDFVVAHGPMIVLGIGQISIVLFGSVGYLMTMTGNGRDASVVIVASALLNVALNAVLIPRYALMGAAIATCTATCVRGLALSVRVHQKLGYNATAFARLR